MAEFKIESDIPIPTYSANPLAIALIQCKVGESIFVPDSEVDYHSVQYAMQRASYKGGKFSRRKQPGGSRVWRIK